MVSIFGRRFRYALPVVRTSVRYKFHRIRVFVSIRPTFENIEDFYHQHRVFCTPKPFSPAEVGRFVKNVPFRKSTGCNEITAEHSRQLSEKGRVTLK